MRALPKVIPMPGNVPGAPTQYPETIGPGLVEMDGSTALGYVRSRYGDSDFQRTGRQRKLLAALAQQISFVDVVSNYGEVTSASNCTDFQARRLRTRFRRKGSRKNEFVHMLNGTGVAVSRALVALLENHQRADGSIAIPKQLQPYVGCDVIGPR